MKAILSSNIPHYHHLAVALERAGMLERYITTTALIGDEPASRLLPLYWRRKLEGRRLRDVPASKVRQIVLPEMLQRTLSRSGIASGRADWLNNHLFDWRAKSYIDSCDVFHFVSSIGLYCARKAKRRGATIVCDVRSLHPRYHRRTVGQEHSSLGLAPPETGESYESKMLEEFDIADHIIVPSESARRSFLAERMPAEKLSVVRYGIELDDFYPAPAQDETFRVLFVGTITPGKGIHYLIEAFNRLSLKQAELVLVGTMDPAMRPVLGRYEGMFTYIPPQPRLDLLKIYNRSSVFVLPSLSDSFSLATLEAMACGLPVIVTEDTGIADLLEPDVHGFIVPSRNPESLAERLAQLYRDPALRAEIGRRAATLARQQTWTKYGDSVIEIYRQLPGCGSITSLTPAGKPATSHL